MKDLNFVKPKKRFFRWPVFVLVVVLTGGFFIWADLDYAKEVTITNAPAASETPPVVRFGMLEKIQEGIALLEKSEPLKYENKIVRQKNGKSVQTGELARKQVALAILDKNTGEVFEHRVWVSEDEIKNYRQTGVINLEPDLTRSGLVDEARPRIVRLVVNWWNSFNTDYGFSDNPNLVVVANKYLVPSSNLGTLPERSKSKYTEIIYVPYSGGLHVSEAVEAGKKYIEENINTAFDQLADGKVASRFAPGYLVTDDIGKDFIKNIILVEHVDPDAFKLADDGGKELVERVLVIIGANQERAYRYTGSPAGASGLAQFIKSTYKNTALKYPSARLIKDFNLGMADHVNAIKAMVLFFDEHKKALASRITRRDIVQPRGITEEMLAAAYNGGPSRVTRSINKFGLAWIGSQLGLSNNSRILRRETLDYVSKFRAIKRLNIF